MTVGDDWLTREEAIKASGLHERTFARWEAAGKFSGERGEGGKKYYDPQVIEDISEGGDKDGDTSLATVVKLLLNQLKASYQHNENLLKSITEPQKAVNEHYTELIKAQSARIESLEERWFKALDAIENMLSMQEERAQKAADAEQSRAIKKDAYELLKKNVPRALSQIGKGAKMRELFESLSYEQLGALLDPQFELLTDAQRAVIADIVKQYQKEQENNGKADTGGVSQQGNEGATGGAGGDSRSSRRKPEGSSEGAKGT